MAKKPEIRIAESPTTHWSYYNRMVERKGKVHATWLIESTWGGRVYRGVLRDWLSICGTANYLRNERKIKRAELATTVTCKLCLRKLEKEGYISGKTQVG